MTRLMMLAGGAPTVGPELDPRPVVDDPVVMQMRPDGRRIGLLRVGPTGRDYTTIHEAMDEGYRMQAVKMAAEGVRTITPDYRVDILVDPGTYVDDWVPALGTGLHVMAANGQRSGALLRYPTAFAGLPSDAARGWSPGNLCWWEGIDVQTLKPTDGSLGPKYPAHGELNAGNTTHATCIITRCKLIPMGSEPGIGTNGGSAAMLVLHDVDVRGGTNNHGWDDKTMPLPMINVFSKCTSNIGLGYSALSDTRADQVWIVDCVAPNLGSDGAKVETHVARSTPTNPIGYKGTLDDRADWPIPVGGLSAAARARYGM